MCECVSDCAHVSERCARREEEKRTERVVDVALELHKGFVLWAGFRAREMLLQVLQRKAAAPSLPLAAHMCLHRLLPCEGVSEGGVRKACGVRKGGRRRGCAAANTDIVGRRCRPLTQSREHGLNLCNLRLALCNKGQEGLGLHGQGE